VIKAAADLGASLPRSLEQELEYILPKNSKFAVENLEFGNNGETKADLKQLKMGGLIQKFATGGGVGTDTVPALLTPGEFVINKKAASRIGASNLHRMNQADKISGFNKGGAVGFIQRFATGGGVESQIGDIAKAVATSTGKSLDEALQKILGEVVRFKVESERVIGGKTGLDSSSPALQQKVDSATFDALQRAIIAVTGSADLLTDDFKNLSGSTAEGSDKFGEVYSALLKVTEQVEEFGEAALDAKSDLETIGNVQTSGRLSATIGAGQKNQGGIITKAIISPLANIGSKIGGIWTLAANKVVEIWKKGGKAVAGAITKASVGLGTIVGAIENAQGEITDPTTGGLFGAAKGGLAGAATGAQIGSSLGLGPVGTAITAAGFAAAGALKGFADAYQQIKLDNILKGLAQSSIDLEKAFEGLDNNVAGSRNQVIQSFGEQFQGTRQLETISSGGTFGERFSAQFFGTENAVDRNRLGGTNAALDAAYGAENRTNEDREIGLGVAAAISSVLPGLDIAIDYFSTNSQAVEQARDALVQQASKNLESATKFAEFSAINAAEADFEEASKITNLFYEGLRKEAEDRLGRPLTNVEDNNLKAQSKQEAALAAFRKEGLDAGRDAAAIEKDIATDRGAAVIQGNKIIEREQKLLDVRITQARAAKEVTIALENQTDIYRRFIANLERANKELERSGVLLDEFLNFDQGATIDRSNENVIGNLLAYTPDEVRAAAQPITGALGGTDQAVRLRENLEASKFFENRLPSLLRGASGDPEAARGVIQQLRGELTAQGLGSEATEAVLKQIAEKIDQQEPGTLLNEIDFGGILSKFSDAAAQGQEALLQATRTYNDALQRSIDLQRKYNDSLNKAADYFTKAAQVQADAAVQLNEAIGRSSSLDELNKSFRLGIQNLTSGLVREGALEAGEFTDPTSVREGISQLRQENSNLEVRNQQIREIQGGLGDTDKDQRLNNQLNEEYRANATEIQNNTDALSRGRQALEEMANSGTEASNALKKFEEEQRKVAGAFQFAQNVFTSSSQENFQRASEIAVAREALSGNTQVLQTQSGRQAAFSGLQQFESMLDPAEYRSLQADLLEQNFAATGQNLDAQAGPTGKTWREILDRMRNPEESPELQEFKRASEAQAQANVELGLLELENTDRIVDEIAKLNQFFQNFPQLLENALRNVAEEQTLEGDIAALETRKKAADTAEDFLPKGFVEKRDANLEKFANAQNVERQRQDELTALRNEGYGDNSSQVRNAKSRLVSATDERIGAQFDVEYDQRAEKTFRKREKDAATEELYVKEKELRDRQEGTRTRAEEAIEDNRRYRAGLPSVEEERKQREAQQQVEAERLGVGTTTNPITGEAEAEFDPFADPSTQPVSMPAVATSTPAVAGQRQKEEREADLEQRFGVTPVEAGEAELAQRLGDNSRRIREDAQYKVDHPDEFPSGEVQQAKNVLNVDKPFEGMRVQAATQAAPAAPPTVGAQAAPVAARRPEPPSLDQRIGAIRQYKEQTGRLNPFQAKELERLQRQRRIEQRKAANAGVPGVPGAAETTTEVSQGVATRQVSQQTEQQTQQQAPQDAFATAINNFGTYVDKLVNFEFPTIPDTITLQANHNVVVTFQGAAALEGLNDSMQHLAIQETDRALAKIWEQSNGQYGGVPRSPAGEAGNTALA
jgi:hypothetical protein